MAPTPDKLISKILSYAVAGIMVLLPFHAILTVWLGSTFGMYDLWRLWKEMLIIILLALSAYLLWRNKRTFRAISALSIVWAIGAYTALHIFGGLWAMILGEANLQAVVFAWIVNLRFLAFFLICTVAASQSGWLALHWKKIVLVPAAIVLVFGLLQAFVLPIDILSHVGYGTQTIAPYQTVDQKSAYLRVQSTLRGSNPLGAYLILVITALLVLLLQKKLPKKLLLGGWLFLGACGLVLGLTYSRSAYVGAIVAVVVSCWLGGSTRKARNIILAVAAMAIVLFGGAIVLLRHNDSVQNAFFHTDEYSQSTTSSNTERAKSLKAALNDVVHEPMGRGPGTAGPASEHLVGKSPRIAENYYLQIGQEVGWLGLVFFVAIVVYVAGYLWRTRAQVLSMALLASLAGISVAGMFVHVWTDDTLALLWWGLAGVAIGAYLLNEKDYRHK